MDEKTSNEVASLAGRVMGGYTPTRDEVLALAGSAMTQAADKQSGEFKHYGGTNDLSVSMDYSAALTAIKEGGRVARRGWNGKGMFVFLVPGSVFKVNREPLLSIVGEGAEIAYRPHIDIKNADGSIAVWVPSITDQMADDWYSV